MMKDLVVSGKLFIFRYKGIPDIYVLIVDGRFLMQRCKDSNLIICRTFKSAKKANVTAFLVSKLGIC